MASLFDLDFSTLTVSPFGFDTLFVSGAASITNGSGTGGGVANPKHGIGIYNRGDTRSIHNSYLDIDMVSMGINWCDVEQSPGVYTWQVRDSGGYISPDFSIDDAAANGYVILLRLFCGIQMPIGGAGAKNVNGTIIKWAASPFVHQGDSLAAVERVSFVSRDWSTTQNTYIPWAGDNTLRILYTRLLTSLNTWLNGTTSNGNRRGDYVIYVPLAMPTENGTEMTINFQSGTFAPTSKVTMDNGVSYGPGTPNVTGDIRAINTACVYSHILPGALPNNATNSDKQNYVQNLWIQAWKDAGDIQAAALTNADTGVVYGSIWGGSMEQTAGPIRDYLVPQYGKTKFFAQSTNWTINYDTYSLISYNFFKKVLAAGGKLGFQTQDPTPTNNNPGMHPADWIPAMTQAMDNFKVHFMETQSKDFADSTYGAENEAYAAAYGTVLTAPTPSTTGKTLVLNTGQGAKFPKNASCPFDVIIWPNGVAPGNGNYEIATCTARTTDTLTLTRHKDGAVVSIAAGYQVGGLEWRAHANAIDWSKGNTQANALDFVATTSDQAYARKNFIANPLTVFYLLNVNSVVSNTGVIILLSSQTDSGDTVQFRLTAANLPRITVNGVADFTGASALQNGDIVEVEHVLNGTMSGYILRVNGTEIHRNLLLPQGTSSRIAFADIGIKSKIAAEIQYNRFAANDTNWVDDTVTPSNPYPPIIDVVSIL